MKTLYEINWHYKDGEQTKFSKFSHCTVTPITVIREGVLPGCSAPSITAIGADGRTFQGSPNDYFESEADAWAEVKQDLLDTIESNDEEVRRLNAETYSLFSFLRTLPDTGDQTMTKQIPDWVEDLPEEQVQPWMVERQGPFVSIRQRNGADPDDWHWVLIPKEDIEEFVRQVTEESAT